MSSALFSALALLVTLNLGTQRRVISVQPEQNPEGSRFTLEEVAGSNAGRFHPGKYKGDKEPATGPGRAYSENGSLYVDSVLVAEAAGDVSYGTSVSRNEFGIKDGIFWSPDSSKVAFYRKDESEVRDYPLFDIKEGRSEMIKYPFAGESSEKIGLGIYDLRHRCTVYIQTDACYISNLSWSPDSRFIYAVTADRSQHNYSLQKFDSVDGACLKTILSEHNEAWAEPYEPVHFLPDGKRFIYSCDTRDGYKSLYLCNDRGIIRRLPTGDADASFKGICGNYVYYTGYSVSAAEPQLFRINIDGRSRAQMLSNGRGFHKIIMEKESYVDIFSDVGNPGWTARFDMNGKVLDTLVIESDPFEGYAKCSLEFGTVKSADGRFDNHYRLFKPLGFDPSKKYPLIVYVYGGPHLQMVNSSYLAGFRNWEMYMAQRGYVVYVQDNRGTPHHGLEYEQAVNRRLGQEEMRDQMVGIRSLLDEPWIDSTRVGVSGWSFGGFMTISLMTSHPEIFAAGACGGPVIDWKWYEVMYGERYMDTPETNPEGFAETSLPEKAGELKAPLLICQGVIDGTVLPINSLNFVQACIENGTYVEYMPYPLSGHNVGGRWRMQLYDTFTKFFDTHLNVKEN